MLDSASSLRLKLLRFPPIIGVIYIHAYFSSITYSQGRLGTDTLDPVTEFIRTFISQGVARIAVPLFFLMSGYLFFANFRWSKTSFLTKVITRMRTLLIPFVFWNCVVLAIYAALQAIPGLRPYFTGSTAVITQLTCTEFLNVIFGIKGYPIAYHFWFIRDLMVLVLLAPVIAIILRYAALPFLMVVYLCWVSGKWPVYIPDNAGVLFFSAGALCGIKGQSLFAFDRYGPLACWAMLPILLVDAIWYTSWFNMPWHRTGLIVGVLAALYLTKPLLAHERLQSFVFGLGGASFFVYAAHEPLLLILRMLAYRFLPLDVPGMMLAIYLLVPLLLMAFLVFCHRALQGLCPRLLSLVTGGR
jgi:peptidoglycan/LPS O-acetylase OafA/YrhL